MSKAVNAKSAKAKAAPPAAVPTWLWYALAGAVLIVYLPALNGPLVFDDRGLQPLQGPTHLRGYLTSVRPLYYASLWLDHRLFGDASFPSHLVNLILHGLNGLLLFHILQRLQQRAGLAVRAGASFFCAALFLLHPLHTEAVSYIASRSEVLAVFFGFGSFLLFLRPAPLTWRRTFAIVLLFGLGIASKEYAFAFVPLMLLTDLWLSPGAPLRGLRPNLKLYVPLALLFAAGVPWALRLASNITAGFGTRGATPLTYFATQCHVIWRYLLLYLVPWRQTIDYNLPFSRSLFEPLPLAGLVLLLASVAAAFYYRKRYPLASWGWLAFLVLLAPTSSIVPIADAMVERRVYVASLGLLAIALQWLAAPAFDLRRARPVLAALIVVYAAVTWNHNGAYEDPVRMWSEAVAANPSNFRARYQLAHTRYLQGDCAAAAAEYERAAALSSKSYYGLYTDWALALDCAGRPDEAITRLKSAVNDVNTADAWATLGMLYGKQGQPEPALEAIDRALKLRPRFDMAWVYRGNVLFNLGRREEAAENFRHALSLNPKNPAAIQGLAAIR